jgi:hypothetical protein
VIIEAGAVAIALGAIVAFIGLLAQDDHKAPARND